MKRNQQHTIPNLNAYDQGFQLGMTLALKSSKINLNKRNPYNPFLLNAKWRSYRLGLQAGFVQGVRIREQNMAINRFKELSQSKKARPYSLEIDR